MPADENAPGFHEAYRGGVWRRGGITSASVGAWWVQMS